jgi:F420-non-reducing hydrogenase iron-sulfur subunit
MCSGTVDPAYIIKALLSGADAVVVGGCHPGDCHYVSGNYKARRRIALLKTILETLGLDEKRVWARWISASEGPEFAQMVKEVTEETRKQGPNPLADNWEL